MPSKSILILGANSDVAKAAIARYAARGCRIVAASRSIGELQSFVDTLPQAGQVAVLHFDATDFGSHRGFYMALPFKPQIVLYAAGFQVHNDQALVDFEGSFRMMQVHYAGAVSILNIIATDQENTQLERIVGLSSLSGVRGRKSNFIYGAQKLPSRSTSPDCGSICSTEK